MGRKEERALTGCTPISPVTPVTPNATIPPLSSPTPVAGAAEANGITLAYESFGPMDGETILLIGGTGMQLVDWPMALVDALVARGYRVIRFDNRDVGRSTHLTEAGAPDAAAIEQVLTAGEPPPLPYTLRDWKRRSFVDVEHACYNRALN